jgi:hypothetical protein
VVEGEKEGVRDRKQTYSRVKERACYRVAGQRDAPGGLRSMPHRQSRLGTGVIRFGRRGEGRHRGRGAWAEVQLCRVSNVHQASRDEGHTWSDRRKVWRVVCRKSRWEPSVELARLVES